MTILGTKTASAALAMMVLFAVLTARAQNTSDQGAAPAATGPDTTTQAIENPPLSGLDQPSFEPGFGARSYLLPKLQVSEAVDTNPSGGLGSNTVLKDVTRGLGSLTLQKIWKIHPLDINYIGGAAWYPGASGSVYQLHSLGAVQRILWRTGQLSIRDSFSYLPQGSFGFNSFGGAGGVTGGGGLGSLGGTSGGGVGGGAGGTTLGGIGFGSLGNQPRITNSSTLDVTQSLSPRSSVVLAGSFALTDFLNNPQGYVNSQQSTGQAGYNYQISRQDQIAVSYAYEEFHFPQAGTGNSFNANVWQVLYGHRISGRLDFRAGGGPQWIHSQTQGVSSSFISGSGQAALTYYRSARTNISLSYSHYANPGSGFFAGANTDSARLALTRTLTRRWSLTTDTGYSYSSRVLKKTTTIANNAQTYDYWYAGGALRYQISRHFGAFADYQYDSIGFGNGFCKLGTPCNTGYGHHVGLIGLDWTPSPIRIE